MLTSIENNHRFFPFFRQYHWDNSPFPPNLRLHSGVHSTCFLNVLRAVRSNPNTVRISYSSITFNPRNLFGSGMMIPIESLNTAELCSGNFVVGNSVGGAARPIFFPGTSFFPCVRARTAVVVQVRQSVGCCCYCCYCRCC